MGVALEILKSLPDLQDKSVVTDAIMALNADIGSHVNTMQSLALEGIFVREELREAGGLPAGENEIAATAVW